MKINFFLMGTAISCLLLLLAVAATAQELKYKIIIDSADLSGVDVELTIPNANGSVRLAMAAHPEYDDKYLRYVQNFTAESAERTLSVTKPDPVIWQIDGVRAPLTVRYRVTPDPSERQWRQSWKPFLTPTGGMVGDLHMLMYVVRREQAPSRLTLDLPQGWNAASGLAPTSDPRAFTGTAEDVLDSPVIVGKFDEWKFKDSFIGIPHQVVIWSPADAKPVDAQATVDGIKRLVDESIKVFGTPPYPRYAFLLENGGSAALEHRTSLNSGITGELKDVFDNIAHEYVHAWNLMDVRPRERIGIRYKFAEPTGVLWWSEGATIMFADLLIRRAGLPAEAGSRVDRLKSMLERYYSSPGYSRLSADTVSRGDSHPEFLGNDYASTHLQGELLVTALDLMIREKTDNRLSSTVVMRVLSQRFDSRRGIDNRDLERVLAEICGNVGPFFRDYIYNAKALDINHYLSIIGLRADVKEIQAVNDQGRPVVDLRIVPVSGEGEFRARILNSESIWARAGLRTGDKVVSADGKPIATWNDFRGWLVGLKIGDTGRVVVLRDGREQPIEVPITGFMRASANIIERSDATAKQLRLRRAWLSAR